MTLLVLALALAIDRLVGDPRFLWSRVPHPIVLAGRAVERLDARLNDASRDAAERRRLGLIAVAVLMAGAAALGVALRTLLAMLPAGFIVEAVLVSVFIAHKSLIDHVGAVRRALMADGLEGGRRAVAHIVGRDVSTLDEAGVARAAMESGAENFSDGVVAPAFWYALFGLPGLLIYKAVNTADSMIGYRSERHEAFGWSAARLDDVLSYIPARLSAALLVMAAAITGGDARAAVAITLRDAPKHKSPNAGWPEAALAGALGLAFGGPRRYGALEVDGVWLNRDGRAEAGPADIRAATRLIDVAWALAVALVVALAFILSAIGR